MRRRPLLVATAMLAWLAGCASGVAAPSPGTVQRLADGVYMVRGSGGSASAENRGRIGNAGFIVGPNGVLAVDTGTSYRHGEALLAAIASVTALPVRLAVVTHTRQEFLFGAAAFRARGIPVEMHARAAQLMAARCEGCLKTLRQTLGEDEMRGTAMWKPDVGFDDSTTVDAIGRPVRLLYFGHSSGPGDVAVLDVASGVLFAGGLLDAGRVPDVVDGRLPAWRQALSRLAAEPVTQVVPGHGPAAPPAVIADVQRYLARLEAKVGSLLAAGVALSDVPDAAALPEYERYDEYGTLHRRNASVVYLRLELEQMLKP